MWTVTIKWNSGKETAFTDVKDVEAFKQSYFGGSGQVPDGVVVQSTWVEPMETPTTVQEELPLDPIPAKPAPKATTAKK